MAVFFSFWKIWTLPLGEWQTRGWDKSGEFCIFRRDPAPATPSWSGSSFPPQGSILSTPVLCRAGQTPSLPRAAFPSFFNLYSYPLVKLNFFQVFKFHFQYFLGGKTPLPFQSCFSPTPFPFFFNLHSNPKFPIQLNFFQFFDFHFQYFFPRAA